MEPEPHQARRPARKRGVSSRLGLGAGATLVLLAGALGLARFAQMPAADLTVPTHRVVEDSRDQGQWSLAIEMDKSALKSEIEAVARRLLTGAPLTTSRQIDVWLGPRGPFNPAYASVRLEPGQPNEPFRLYLHRH